MIVLEPLLATFDLLVEVEELLTLCLERLVVGMSDLHVHVHQIIQEPEDFEEHGESMLTHEAKLDGRVKQRLSELIITDRKSARASKHVACQFLLVGEHKLAATVARADLP